MFNSSKENLTVHIIPCIILLITIIIAFTSSEILRKFLVLVSAFLLGISCQKTIYIIKNRKENKNG